MSEYNFVQCFGLSQLAWHNRPKLFIRSFSKLFQVTFFIIIFQNPKVNIQVHNDHGVLIRPVLCLKCVELNSLPSTPWSFCTCVSISGTVKLQAVDWSTIQFWNFHERYWKENKLAGTICFQVRIPSKRIENYYRFSFL